MLLRNKNAVVYGGGGAIGGAVARTFAREATLLDNTPKEAIHGIVEGPPAREVA